MAKLVDSSLMEKRIEHPLLSRENTTSNLARDFGVLGLAFPHLSQPPLRGQEEVEMNPLAYEGDASSPQPSCCATRA